ncbi:hypothetical protein BDR26DRAFT_922375 [Obelidium mucronatum]|nr:hypothetical protein BDR26DRAFT_922375 [Obelidium mucronatum]
MQESEPHSEYTHLCGPNTPRKRAATSEVWSSIKRLKPAHPAYEKSTHICREANCNRLLKLSRSNSKDTTSSWVSTAAVNHMVKYHCTSGVAVEATKRATAAAASKVDQQLDFTLSNSEKTGAKLVSLKKTGSFSVADNAASYISASIKFYCYSSTHVMKSTFSDPLFRGMFKALVYPEEPPVLTDKSLKLWVDAEFEIMLIFVQYMLMQKHQQAHGNRFAQFIHDGGTLDNKMKFQAMAVQFVDPNFACNHVVSIAFSASLSNTNDAVATKVKALFKQRTGLDFEGAVSSMIQDRAALGVADLLDIEEEACLMHDGDKVGKSAIGALTRSNNKIVVNPFPEGTKLVKLIHSVATFFNYEQRREALFVACEKIGNVPHIRAKVDLNTTRVESAHTLLESVLRINSGLRYFMSLPPNKQHEPCPKIDAGQWEEVGEFEALLNCSRIMTHLAQTETGFCGAFRNLIISLTSNALRAPTLKVIDQAAVGISPVLPRVEVRMEDLSPVGKTCRMRAILELERRFCGNTSETIENSPIECSDRLLLSTLLDLRTVHSNHLTAAQRKTAKSLLQDEYVNFSEQCARFLFEAQNPRPSSPATIAATSKSRKKKIDLSHQLASGFIYGHSAWVEYNSTGSDDEASSELMAPDFTFDKKAAKNEFERSFSNWVNLRIDWHELFPTLQVGPLDLVDDLMMVDMGVVYRKFQTMDPDQKKYGFLPLMASCSRGQIGALPAESYCERMLSCANNILTKGNSLLGVEELEKLVVLRMNRYFMEFMRLNYSHVSKQEFNETRV